MTEAQRITFDPAVMGGKPCVRGLRVTVGTVVGLLAAGRTAQEILTEYPYLEPADIQACLAYAAWVEFPRFSGEVTACESTALQSTSARS